MPQELLQTYTVENRGQGWGKRNVVSANDLHKYTQPDGTFQLASTAAGDGAPEGDYAVTVVWPAKGAHGDTFGPDRLEGKFADPKNPLCRATVRDW